MKKSGRPLRLLLAGNHSCGNRGDAAILRGLVDAIEEREPEAELTITSRFPTSSAFLLGRHVVPDWTYDWPDDAAIRPYRLKRRVVAAVPGLLRSAVERGGRRGWLLPRAVSDRIERLREYDAVVQVGGSFFVDLYGNRQYETPYCAILADRPLHLIGHSLGPFASPSSRRFAATLLTHAGNTVLREPVSRALIERDGLPLDRISMGADTAWLVRPGADRSDMRGWVRARAHARPAVAITLRDLEPFSTRLGIDQARYEQAYAQFCLTMIEHGHDIVAVSTCTGIEGYRDDRMPALRVAARVGRPDRFHVMMDEINDVELGHLLSACHLLVGTRLHSAIIALNFGTAAIALNYEHKSRGIMQALGVPEFAADLTDLLDSSLVERALAIAWDRDALGPKITQAVAVQRDIAGRSVTDMLQSIGKVL